MKDNINHIDLQDILLLYSTYEEDKIINTVTIDLIHFINNEIDVQFGNYSKIPTSLIMKQVEYSKQKNKLVEIWNRLSTAEKHKFYEKMKTEFYLDVIKTNE